MIRLLCEQLPRGAVRDGEGTQCSEGNGEEDPSRQQEAGGPPSSQSRQASPSGRKAHQGQEERQGGQAGSARGNCPEINLKQTPYLDLNLSRFVPLTPSPPYPSILSYLLILSRVSLFSTLFC